MINMMMRQNSQISKSIVTRRMWQINHTRGAWAGLLAWALVLPAIAQEPAAPQAPEAAPPALTAPFVDDTHARTLHRVVSDWAEDGAVGGQRPAPVRVHRAAGLRVTLRTQGHLLGYGDAWRDDLEAFLQSPDPTAPENAGRAPLNLVPLAEAAAFEAFAAADRRLRDAATDAALMARIRPEVQGAGAVPKINELFNNLTIDIQVAHTPRPIVLGVAEPKQAALTRYVSGHQGLIADGPGDKDQDDAWTVVWPATALSHNLAPLGQLRSLAKAHPDIAFHEIDVFGRADGPRLWRFENLHVVRPRPGLPVQTLTRGGVPLPRAALDQIALRERSERLAGFLLDRFIGQGTVRGQYLPSADRFDPQLATLRNAALAGYALAEHRATQDRLNAADPLGGRIAARLDDLLMRVASNLDAPQSPLVLQPDESALLLLTRLSVRPPMPAVDGQPNEDPALRPGGDPIARRLAADLREKLGQGDQRGLVFRPSANPEDPDAATRAASAIASFALGRYADLHGDADALADADAVADALWAGNAVGDGNALPWLARAHQTVARPWIEAGLLTEDDATQRQATLIHTLDRYQEFQIVAPPPGVPKDILGGFDIPAATPPAAPRPDWRTAPLLLGYATGMALEDGQEERRTDLGRLLTAQAAARFLAQLMFDPSDAYYVRAPELAIGGVRLALDDNRLRLPPSAMTLLAFDRLRITLDDRAAQQAGE
ncbi:MAG: hypothetical protein AAGF84_04355 [Planctomycetota bacterium]